MSNKSYKYIGRGSYSGVIVLFYGSKFGRVIDGGSSRHKSGDIKDDWYEPNFENITRKYLTNTYGKCESQEHADFICELAENAGFTPENDYYEEKGNVWFSFNHETGSFFDERKAKDDNEKPISLPLPPKENEMESQLPTASSGTEMPEVKSVKPIYTKEMHERGLLPKVGMECLIAYKGGNTFKGKIKYISKDGFVYERENGPDSFNGSIDIVKFKPIPTIEDDLFDRASKLMDRELTQSEFVFDLMDKYNITPKQTGE